MVLSGTSICGSLRMHCPGRMGIVSSSVWTSTSIRTLHANPYCAPLGATSLVWISTPCLGTTTALNTGNQNIGRQYFMWRMCWTAPSSSQLSHSIILHSPVLPGHSSNAPWWIHFVPINSLLLTLPDSQRSQLFQIERNQCLSLVWLGRILYDGRNSNPRAASVEMILKLSLVPQLSRFFMIWSFCNSTYAPSEFNTCHLKKVIRP